MEWILRRSRRTYRVLPLAVATAAFSLAGCGSDNSYKNKPRPPEPINITAAITKKSVSISPAQLGAGPVVILISNQTDTRQVAIIESNEAASSTASQGKPRDPLCTSSKFCERTGFIPPEDTAQIKVVVQPDTVYRLKTGDGKITPAQLRVTAERPSAQNDVLTP